jgi:hypothetical protein
MFVNLRNLFGAAPDRRTVRAGSSCSALKRPMVSLPRSVLLNSPRRKTCGFGRSSTRPSPLCRCFRFEELRTPRTPARGVVASSSRAAGTSRRRADLRWAIVLMGSREWRRRPEPRRQYRTVAQAGAASPPRSAERRACVRTVRQYFSQTSKERDKRKAWIGSAALAPTDVALGARGLAWPRAVGHAPTHHHGETERSAARRGGGPGHAEAPPPPQPRTAALPRTPDPRPRPRTPAPAPSGPLAGRNPGWAGSLPLRDAL